MATLIFVDKDNEEPGSRLASKDGLKLGSGAKALDGKLQVSTPRVGKVFSAPALPKSSRKALGTVNRVTEKLARTNRPLKQKQPTLTVKKITEKAAKTQGSVPASDDAYPEIENFFPFNPLDFESFDLPEEHQIAHLPLSGVPLMILNEEKGLEKLLHLDPPSPLKTPFLPWESNPMQSPSSILSTLDIELPPVCYDADI
ncbi:securin [Psammomys obesus]|uniref:securin n=1 Tax=Psammomys obesus TaxID=48139 RepID=UPI00245290F4|nr:securin [Psammomys obesus]XP_055466680.1 securin [Psammomys obesus]XP_055466681.1 securin [Psammomys obesus]